ncbi:hypothetical protein HBB16_20615 [Pseudonocardia sp. MCCB 268]|nr:hypothetical protein [Pseudonocardia cytotoxica]
MPFTDWQNYFQLRPALLPGPHRRPSTATPTPLQGRRRPVRLVWKNSADLPGGSYVVERWQDNQALTLAPTRAGTGRPSPRWIKLIMRVITDATQEPGSPCRTTRCR